MQALSSTRLPKARQPFGARGRSVVVHAAPTNIRDFLGRMESLGKCRFIVLGEGAILESVADWSKCSYVDIPSKGMLATVASPDKSFECHIYLQKVAQAKLARSKAKAGDWDTYATRFLDSDGKVLMSCLLHGQKGVYDPASVTAWQALANEFGEVVTFST